MPKSNAIDVDRAEWLIENVYAEEAETLADDWSEKPEDRALRFHWPTIKEEDPQFARQLLPNPEEAVTVIQNALAKKHNQLLDDTAIRFQNVPEKVTYRVGDLRTHHLRTLVAIECEVVDVDPVRPLITRAAFECQRCGTLTHLPQTYGDIREPAECRGCEDDGPFLLLEEKSTMVDHQPIVVTPLESSLEEPPVIPIYLTRDLVGRVGEEDELTVIGIYRTLPFSRQDETRLNVFLDANALDVEHQSRADELTQTELDEAIKETVVDLQADDGSEYGSPRLDVVDEVVSEYGAREVEVENRIDALDEATREDIFVIADRVAVRD